MAGLLDFINTPEGQGLLAGAFGAAAGARRGAPWNTLGRGGLAGLAGYSGAIDRQAEAAQQAELNKEREQMRQVREMQIAQARTAAERAQAEQQWRAGLPSLLKPKPEEIDQFTGTTQMVAPDQEQIRQYLMRPESPFADDILKQTLFPEPRKTLTVGDTVLDAKTMEVLYRTPKGAGDDLPTKVNEYEYAKANGYKGTFDQYVTLGPTIMAAAQAPLREAQIENIVRENEYNLPPAPRPRAGASSGPVTVTVGGKMYSFPDQKSANNFKMKAGVK